LDATIRAPFRLSGYRGVDNNFGQTLFEIADRVLRHLSVLQRQWRTMARLTSRSMGVEKLEGLLVAAVELCTLVKASYLSPSLPFLLCFELLKYFRRVLAKGGRSAAVRPGSQPHSNETASGAGLSSTMYLVLAVAFAATLMLRSEGWAQDATPNGNGPLFPQATVKTGMTSADVLKQEERQRILGVVPNFNTVESSAGVPSLSPGQKFHLMYKSSVDPFVFVADAFVAGLSQARDTNPGFGQGAEGYFKRFGASYLDTADGNLWGNAILPIVFKEDPRYFRLGSGTFTHRFLYSAATTVWCRRDNGTWGPNYANVLGNFISGGISNAYYPAAERGLGQTVDGALTVTAEGVIGAEFVEFWPDISRHLFKNHQSAQ
jgi:hypothetical protein